MDTDRLALSKTLLRDELEHILDRFSAVTVLDALQEVCFLKQEHVQANWQDSELARRWGRLGLRLGRAVKVAHDLQL